MKPDGGQADKKTLRDEFAEHALMGIISAIPHSIDMVHHDQCIGGDFTAVVSKLAYEFADSMLIERTK